ncbi:hypothetical protein [Suicoccus acidiformans]|nr:hypothetical protein [Suicoccus acidiformans]
MQVNDFKNIQEAIKYEVLQDEKEYLKPEFHCLKSKNSLKTLK